jgi:hypothetical protein
VFTTTPATRDYTRRTIKGETLRTMILRSVAQQRAAIDHGDIELAELYAKTTTVLLDRHLHRAQHWTARG